MPEVVKRFRKDERGVVLPIVGLTMTVILGIAGFGVDFGMAYHERRRLQAGADIAALAAVRSTDAEASSRRSLSENGYRSPSGLVVTPGTYRADAAVAPGDRFTPGGTAPNAVRVQLVSETRTGLTRLVGAPATLRMGATATALQSNMAAYGIGSSLATVDGGIVNAMTGALLGSQVSLGVLDYRSLANLRVDLMSVLRNVAASQGIQAGNYDSLLKAPVPARAFLSAVADAARLGGASTSALNALSAAAGALGARNVRLADFLGLGEAGQIPLSSAPAPISVDSLSLVTGTAALANGTNQVAVDLAALPAGIAKARVTFAVGEPWVTSGMVRTGHRLATAQLRALVEFEIPLPLGLGSIRLPVYLQGAQGSATLQAVTCPWTSRSERSVTLDVATGAADIAIGDVPRQSLDRFSPPPQVSPATMLSLPLVTLRGSARVRIGETRQRVTFNDGDIEANRTRTVSGGLGSPVGSLLSGLNLELDGLPLGNLLGLKPAVASTLSALSPSLDAVVKSVLSAMGIRIGAVDVAAQGVRCDGAVLVN